MFDKVFPMARIVAFFSFFLILFITTAASAYENTILQLDTGGHMGTIRDVIFTPDGKQLVSAADDKTIRVWDLATGKTVRTIRGQSSSGQTGQIFAMALSPDGKWLAVGGFFNKPGNPREVVRLYDFESGRLIALLKGHNDAISGLAFSPDSQHLISGGSDNIAIIWDIRTKRLKQLLRGHSKRVYGVSFTPDGKRAVTGSIDHDLRLWDVSSGTQIAYMRGHSGKVRKLITLPNGDIVSGDESGEIRLWDGQTGRHKKLLMKQQTSIGTLATDSGGTYLPFCASHNAYGNYGCRVYNISTGHLQTSYNGQRSVVLASAVSPDGRWVATGGGFNNEIHIWDIRTGSPRLTKDGKPLILRGVGQRVLAVGISKDKKNISWGSISSRHSSQGSGPLQYKLTLPTAKNSQVKPEELDPKIGNTYLRAIIQEQNRNGLWTLSHRRGGQFNYPEAILDIKRNGRTVASISRGLATGLVHNSYSFIRNENLIISAGSNGVLTAYNRRGWKLGEFVGHESEIWGLAPSQDGNILVTGSSDQTVRLWNINKRELLATLFRSKNGEWVMWTPEGFFMGSENGGKLVGWQINQGINKEARYVNADQLRKIFYRPDLVVAKINGDPDKDLQKAVRRFDVVKILRSGAAPDLEILTPGDNWETDDNKAVIKVKITDAGGGVGKVLWKVNGQLRGNTEGQPGVNTLKLALGKTDNLIEVVAFNKAGVIQSRPANVKVRVRRQLLTGKPDLYVLAVGVDDYFDSSLKLEYAVKDATRLVRVLKEAAEQQEGKNYYRKVIVESLTDAQVTRKNMSAAFSRIGETMQATDVFVFFIAGHGVTEQGDYYYLPPNFRNVGSGPVMKYGFGPKDWEKWTSNIIAEKSLLIFDTCEAGSVAKIIRRGAEQLTAYERLKDHTGRVIVMATNSREVALEGYRNKHGVLTYAMLEAIALGDNNQDQQIMLTELIGYIADRVPQMSCELTQEDGEACYRQVPQANLSGAVFPIVPRYEKAHPERIAVGGKLQIGDAYPGQLTHATIKAVSLLDAPDGKVLKKLPLFYKLNPVNEKEAHTLVARDGKIFGYIRTEFLQILQ